MNFLNAFKISTIQRKRIMSCAMMKGFIVPITYHDHFISAGGIIDSFFKFYIRYLSYLLLPNVYWVIVLSTTYRAIVFHVNIQCNSFPIMDKL